MTAPRTPKPLLKRCARVATVLATAGLLVFPAGGVAGPLPLDNLSIGRALQGIGVSPATTRAVTAESVPAEPVLTATDPDSPANDNSPKVKGTADPGTTVRIYTKSGCSGAVEASDSAAVFNSIGIQVSVPDDSTTTFRATADDGLGNVSPCSSSSIDYTEDSTPPASPPDFTGTDPTSPANDNSPRILGTAPAGTTVRLYTTSDCSGASAAGGSAATFSSSGIQVSVSDDSTTTFRATAADQAGNASDCSPGSIAYAEDSTPPAPPDLTATVPDSPANDNSPSVKGTAEPGSTIRLYTTSDCSDVPAGSGSAGAFSLVGVQVTVPDDSTTTFRATATDDAGNVSACSSTSIAYVEDSTPPVQPDPTATNPVSPANDNGPRIEGTAEAGATVRVYTDADCSGAVAASGSAATFTSTGIQVSVPDDSTTAFRVTATDQAGNVSACSAPIDYTEDSTAPDPPELTATVPNPPANENAPRIRGTSVPGTTVQVYTDANCAAPVAANGSAAQFSSPGLQVLVGDDTATTFRGTATDAAGNVSACSPSSVAYIEDSTPPEAPKLTTTDPVAPANNNSPKVTGSAELGTTVRLYTTSDCSGAVAASGGATAFATGGLQVSVPDDSTTTYRAIATDLAGNASGCSGTELIANVKPTFREYYDLANDPWELTNYLGDSDFMNDPPAQTLNALHAQLVSDLTCAGRGEVPGRPACP
jgi:hypothetical protein